MYSLVNEKRKSFCLYFSLSLPILFVALMAILSIGTIRNVKADNQLPLNPRQVRVGHLSSDSEPGRKDYVYLLKNAGPNFSIAAYTPAGQQLFIIPSNDLGGITHQEIVDVVDLDGDGNSEILAIDRGNANVPSISPGFFIYNGDGTTRLSYTFRPGRQVSINGVGVYDDFLNPGQKRIVVAPEGGYSESQLTASIYFFNANGASTEYVVAISNSNESLAFPGVMIGNIDNVGGDEIVIAAKGRILAFNNDGSIRFASQFIDPTGSFTNVNHTDIPPGSNTDFMGRRYGIHKLINVDSDSDLELILTGDGQSTQPPLAVFPGGVFQAFDLPPGPTSHDYIGPKWTKWLPRANRNYASEAPFSTTYPQIPDSYKTVVPYDGITDVNGDGVPDIVVTEYPTSGGPFARFINAATGVETAPKIDGICIGVGFFSSNQPTADLIVYNPDPNVPSNSTYKIWRCNPNTYKMAIIAVIGSPFSGALELVGDETKDRNIAQAGYHFRVLTTKSNGVTAFVGNTSASYASGNPALELPCPRGLAAWNTQGGAVQRSLNVSPSPGKLLGIVAINDPNNKVWSINLENVCNTPTNTTRSYVQSGSTLVPLEEGCTYSLSSTSASFASNTGTGSVSVTATAGCNWTATSNDGWITVTSGSNGSGNGTVQFSVAVNSNTMIRNGTITIAGQTFTVYQGILFNDVPEGAPFYTEIGKLSARSVTTGCTSTTYCPNALVNREQMAAFIIRALGEFNPPTPGSQRFTDVPPSNFFYNFIDRMAVLGITTGCTSTTYCPAQTVSQEQMAAFMMRARGEFNPPTPGSQRFNDVPPNNFFYNFIDRMAVLGIWTGCSQDPPLYCPTAGVTRAEMAALLVRAFNL